MKKLLIVFLALASASCIHQTIRTETRFIDFYTFEDVWHASIRAAHNIGFTINSIDKDAGFIGAESGRYIGQKVPPRLSIFISEARGRIYVNCRVLQKEQYIDVFGHGNRIVQTFMQALYVDLNGQHSRRRYFDMY